MALAEQRSSTRAQTPTPIEVVALVTSAGGLQALSVVLGSLAEDFPAAIVVGQHLSGSGSSLVRILERRIALPVEWATDGAALRPGRVLVCPARSVVEVLPDGSCAVRPSAGTITDRPLDALLGSVGDSYGVRAVGVVLTGMGHDGAQGVVALKAAGAVVIAQDAATADEPAMPGAALDAGADLALPLDEIGAALVDLAAGHDLPRPKAEIEAIRELFGDQGEVAALAMSIEWRLTPLGPVVAWPNELRTTMRLAVACATPVAIFWTVDLLLLYNEAAVPTVGGRLAEVFARPFREAFPEARSLLEPVYEQVMGGTAVSIPGLKLPPRRFGRTEDAWFDVTYIPIHDAQGPVAGFYTSYMERTAEVLAARRLAVLNALGSASRAAGRREALAGSIEVIEASDDVLFAIAYLVDQPATMAGLVSAVGVEEGGALAPRLIRLEAGSAWPLSGISQPGSLTTLTRASQASWSELTQ
jgi:hypothetical protein